ncbi:hypothetical protein [Microvirga sp. 17 mud 1-3]|uniref:hypothetical protein n=1 Tax=Microvirga sp. 17 mud 1-3 TaxID=2082949 RepID=UPI000D6B95E3|nr:hypothetical protein [Microvirga sp. 17 mud 1-3]AWM86660.1 hypothetical protein C4E04_07940 [Microvirga sp. 17 mud 1-3]
MPAKPHVLVAAVALVFWSPTLLAATPEETRCLSLIEATKSAEQEARGQHAIYQQDKTEAHRCAYLRKALVHFDTMKKMGKACMAFQPELAKQVISTANRSAPNIRKESGCRFPR